MNLISIEFLLFFIITLFLYYCIPKKIQWVFLLLASLFFYLQADPVYIVFLFFSIVTTFLFGLGINSVQKTKIKKFLLVLAILSNIGLLFFIKFYSYGTSALQLLLQKINITVAFPSFKIIFPLGISFYILQVVGYCIDIYRGKYNAERNLLKYALFVSFFPHIIQGPIARFDTIAHQLMAPHKFEYNNFKFGLQLMLFGFFKKLVIADRVAILVNQVFNNYQEYAGLQFVIAAIAYSIQIYADFSGCVDICRGVSQCFGINLSHNFNHPYFATSVADFWRRWHISLSTWFRDYIYIPLGGNKKGIYRKYLNILIVFFVSGLWHGVGIHYMIWGFLHGFYQVIGYLLKPIKEKLIKKWNINTNVFSYRFTQQTITFLLITFAWIFFRANTMQAFYIIKSIFTTLNITALLPENIVKLGLSLPQLNVTIFSIIVLFIVSLLQEKISIREVLSKQNLWFRWSIYLLSLFFVLIYGVYGPGFSGQQFIYMQF